MPTTRSIRFRPAVDSLETRAVPSSVKAVLAHGVLTVSRDDTSEPIQIDVLTIAVKRHNRAGMRNGSVVVEGVARFDLRRVKAITIDPGANTDNVIVNEPPKARIPVTLLTRTTSTLMAPPPATGGVVVPGVTGVQSAMEQAIFDLINAQRVQHGLNPLRANSKLVTAAQIHARDMASIDMLQHDLPGVAQPSLISRAEFVGYKYTWLGENIASYFTNAQTVVNAWMASPAHRANILQANFTDAGIGIGRDATGNLFFCQEFGSTAQ